MKALATLVLVFACSTAFGSEIDNISTHYMSLRDSDRPLDARVQKAIDSALRDSTSCDAKAFGDRVAGDLVSMRFYSGAMERFAWNDSEISRITRPMKDSIYANTPFARSIVGVAYGLDPIIAVSGTKLGTDKIGHFIDHGHNLYSLAARGAKLEDLVRYSIGEEEGAFGWSTTGIKSYADMAADLDGYSFWQDLYGQGAHPFVRCEQGRLLLTHPFHFADYVTVAWDEATNCNQYDGESLSVVSKSEVEFILEDMELPPQTCDSTYESYRLEAKGLFSAAVEKNVKALEGATGQRFACPIEPGLCPGMQSRYEERYGAAAAEKILSPLCR